MATTIICKSQKCPYRSKTPLKKWVLKCPDGTTMPCYSCTLESITLTPMFDFDGQVYGAFGYTPVECYEYSKHCEDTRVIMEE